jgi:hypothetical protein
MDPEPTQDELRDWWDHLRAGTRTWLTANPEAQIPEDQVDEVMSYQNGITTFARWDRGLRAVHLRDKAQAFVRAQ